MIGGKEKKYYCRNLITITQTLQSCYIKNYWCYNWFRYVLNDFWNLWYLTHVSTWVSDLILKNLKANKSKGQK